MCPDPHSCVELNVAEQAPPSGVSCNLDGPMAPREEHASSNVERARVNVTRNIKRAMQAIASESPCLGRHLGNRVQTERLCNYAPDEYAPMEFDLE